MMKLALQHLLDFVLEGEDEPLIRAAGPHTPELPRLLLQARALVELLVGGPDEVGPQVRARLSQAQGLVRGPRPEGIRLAMSDRIFESRESFSDLRFKKKASTYSAVRYSSFEADANRIAHARATLSASATPPTARVAFDRLVMELRRSEAEHQPTLVVDLSLSPKRAWDGGWVLWFPQATETAPGQAVRSRFDEAGVAQLPWPNLGRGALRVDGDRASLIDLEIAP